MLLFSALHLNSILICKTFQYKNTFTEDLWAALEEASNKPVGAVMSTWTKQMGFPVVEVGVYLKCIANICSFHIISSQGPTSHFTCRAQLYIYIAHFTIIVHNIGTFVLQVSSEQKGPDRVLTLTQSKFCADGSPGNDNLWMVPITVSTQEEPSKVTQQFSSPFFIRSSIYFVFLRSGTVIKYYQLW